jgi:hypothetical protein
MQGRKDNIMPLFNPIQDRRRTMLAYKIKHWPWSRLSLSAKELIIANKTEYMLRDDIILFSNETHDVLFRRGVLYPIVWVYNNIPTESEWHRMDKTIRIEFRASPAIEGGRVAILSKLPRSVKDNIQDVDYEHTI